MKIQMVLLRANERFKRVAVRSHMNHRIFIAFTALVSSIFLDYRVIAQTGNEAVDAGMFSSHRIEKNGFVVIKTIYEVSPIETTECKPPGPKRYEYITRYTIFRGDIKVLEEDGETFPSSLSLNDEILFEDADFDGSPDLQIPIAVNQKKYFGFDQKTGRFQELFISRLSDLKIDPVTQTATGVLYEYGFPKSKPIRRTRYVLRGAGLPQVSQVVEEM